MPSPAPRADSAARPAPSSTASGARPATPATDSVQRLAPPQVAHAHGWMALASTGVDRLLRAHPEYDGRGVLIGILDTGIDPGVPGLATTSTGSPKLLDLRDFSGEGAVALSPVTPRGDSVTVGGRTLGGFGRVAALSTAGPYFGGTIAEIPLGAPPAADLNGNGAVRDTLPVVVARATDGWVLLRRHRRRRLARGRAAGARLPDRSRIVRVVARRGEAQGERRRELLRQCRRPAAGPLLRYRVPRHPRGGHRGGSRHLRRRRIRRRGAGRAAPRVSRSPTARREASRRREACSVRSTTPFDSPSRAACPWCST